MANQTIYPYGPGGSLPTSIAIVNDLTTGGADKALSAQMGKEMGAELDTIVSVADPMPDGYTIKKWLNADENDVAFGQEVDITNANYAVTDYIPVAGYAKAKIYVITGASSAAKDYAGIIFYDSSKLPLSGQVTCTGTSASEGVFNISIPANCSYIRYSKWADGAVGTLYSEMVSIAQNFSDTTKFLGEPVAFTGKTARKYVDANPNSANFGEMVTISSASYAASDLVPCAGYDYAVVSLITGSSVADVVNNSGWVFYDENETPIYSGRPTFGQQAAGRRITIPIPISAAYICTTCWASADVPIYLYKKNTLQSKVDELFAPFDAPIPNKLRPFSTGEYGYTGKAVELVHKLSVTQVARVPGQQSCLVYGNYIFGYEKGVQEFYLLDLAASTSSPSSLKRWSAATVLGVGVSGLHANSMSASGMFVDNTDELPLILVSGNMDDLSYVSFVLRCYNDPQNGWTLELRYSITNDQSIGWQLCVSEDGTIVGNNDAYAITTQKIDASRTTDQTITRTDILVELTELIGSLPFVGQASAVANNQLFMIVGYGPGYLVVYDLTARRIQNVFSLAEIGIMGEPEGLSIYNGKMYISCTPGILYELIFG